MGLNTEIGWCDATFNPWWGCSKRSDGCKNCFAIPIAQRRGLDIWGPPATTSRHVFGDSHWAEPKRWNRKANASGKRLRVFCGSMCDVFEDHPDVVTARRRLWDLIEETAGLDWLLLTKRPENILAMVPEEWGRYGWPAHVRVGVSVEDQANADERIPTLLEVPAAIRFLSCEPLLAALDLSRYLGPDRISWAIVGGETGPSYRLMRLPWLEGIVEQCQEAQVPVFVKQDSGTRPGHQGRISDGHWSLKQSPTPSI